MKHTKKITILHSNDMHGDFLAEQLDNKLVGGVSMLSGYVEKVRSEEKMFSMHRSCKRPENFLRPTMSAAGTVSRAATAWHWTAKALVSMLNSRMVP